jgi:hypothetical protein
MEDLYKIIEQQKQIIYMLQKEIETLKEKLKKTL